MKITDILVEKRDSELGPDLTCRITLEDGSQIAAMAPWRNTLGLWASKSDARAPAEIAAVLRNFARAIEEAA